MNEGPEDRENDGNNMAKSTFVWTLITAFGFVATVVVFILR